MQLRLEKIINRIIEYGFYTLFFLVPLLFNPSRNFPSFELFEWNKMLFVYFITGLILTAWIAKMILYRRIIFRHSPFDLPLLLFLISQALSALFSIDRHVSVFGYYSRFHGGFLSTVTYLVLFYAFITHKDLINFKKLLLSVFSSALAVAIYGVLEKLGVDKNIWVQDVQARVFSTLGQPNWLAAYLAILIPISIGLIISNIPANQDPVLPDNNQKSGTDNKIQYFIKIIKSLGLFENWYYWIIGLLFYTCLLFTRSRSGFLGFWGAISVFWIFIFTVKFPKTRKIILPHMFSSGARRLKDIKSFLWSVYRQPSILQMAFIRLTKKCLKHNKVKLFLLLNLLFIILNFIFLTPFDQYNRIASFQLFQRNKSAAVITAPTGDTVLNVGITDSADIRKIVWEGAMNIAKAYPLFGTGPETFAYAYYKFRPAAHNMTSEWDFLYNKAHNEYLNYAATSGFLGLIIYLSVIASVIFWSIKKMLRLPAGEAGTPNYQLRTIIVALMVSYISILITNFFGFSVVVVGLYFFLIPAVIFVYTDNNVPAASLPISEHTKTSQKIQFFSLGLVFLYFTFVLTKFWIADSFYARALSLSRQENYTDAYKYIYTAVNLRTGEPVYHDEKAGIAASLASLAYQNENATLSAKLSLEAVNESSKALKISPQNVNFWKTRTRVFFMLSEMNPQFTDAALDAIKITRELAPTDAKIAYNVAVISGRADKKQEAIAALNKAIELKPDYRDAYIALSLFYEETGQIDKARATLETVLIKINPNDDEVKNRLEKL